MMATLSTFRPAVKDRQHGLEVQMLTLGYGTFVSLLASLIDVSLKDRGLPPILFNPRQRLSEGLLASVTAKATRGKVQERHLAPNVQVPHTTHLALMQRCRDFATPWTDGHLISMLADDVHNSLVIQLLKSILDDIQLGYAQ
jgi:hypothetical protein